MRGMTGTAASRAIEELLGRMTREEKVGQLVMAVNAPGWPGLSDVETLIRNYHIGSFISFAYHALDPAGAAAQNNALQAIASGTRLGIPLLNAADFEQGAASLMPGHATDVPHQMGLGATGDPDAAALAAGIVGREERALGFHWTFAPIADVNVNPANPVIGVRSFGGDTQLVTDMVVRQVAAYRHAGIMATAKHFPGHGDTSVDSHTGLPVIPDDWETFSQVHLPPFLAAIRHGVDAIMTAHIIFAALDPELPATLSPRILTGLLRGELGYEGIIVTDAMSMKGVSERWGMANASVMAVQAGADVVIADGTTEDQIQLVEALLRATDDGSISTERLDSAVCRVLLAKEALGLLDDPNVDPQRATTIVASPEHLAASAELAARSITLVRNEGVLPFDPHSSAATLVVGVTNFSQFGGPSVTHVPAVADMVRGSSAGTVLPWSSVTDDPTEKEIAQAVALARQADRIIVLTWARGTVPSGQVRMVEAMLATGKPVAAIATGTPYDLAQYRRAQAYLTTYALSFVPTVLASPRVLEAAIRVLFGAQPGGRLPVSIPELYPVGHALQYPA